MKTRNKTDSPKPDKPSANTPTFRWNDEVVTELQFNDLMDDHKKWVASLENAFEFPAEYPVEHKPAKRTKKK